jgi:hypothetical protein
LFGLKPFFVVFCPLQGEPRGPGYLEQTLGAMMTTFIVVVASTGRTTRGHGYLEQTLAAMMTTFIQTKIRS